MMSLARPAVDSSNSSLGFTYSADSVDKALRMVGGGNRMLLFRYNLLDKTNTFKKQLSTVTSGHVTYDYTQQIKRTAEFDLMEDSDINYLSDRIQPFALLKMSDGNFAQFPLGVFLLSTPPQQTDDALVVTRQVTAYDLNQILVDDKTTDRYVIASGTNYISAISTILSNEGITQTNLTSTTLTLQTALDWKGGTPWLTIINDLLKQINYKSLWFDENGIAVAEPWSSPSVLTSGYTYKDDSDSVIFPSLNRNYDLFSVPNKWIVVVAQTDQATLVSTYTNSNSSSPTSTVNRGRTIVHFEENLNAPLSQTLDSFAQRLAFQDSQVYETIVYESAIMPFHQDYDVITLEFSALNISDKYSEVGWSFPLVAGGKMSHTIRKVVSV